MPYQSFYLLFLYRIPVTLLLLVIAENVYASSITIGNFGGANVNMHFETATRTWTPTGSSASKLDVSSLATTLNGGHVAIRTNGPGNIEFIAEEFMYTAPGIRILTLSADGNITVSQTSPGGLPLHYVVEATGNVTVGYEGLVTNGGAFTSSGVNLLIDGAPLSTGSGYVDLTHSGVINSTAAGIKTAGGAFTIHSGTALLSGNGVLTGGGAVTIHSGSTTLDGNGIETDGGNFYFKGEDFIIGGQGVRTGGGDVAIEAAGDLSASLRGVETGTLLIPGGKFTSSGKDFSAVDGGIKTYGGDIILHHTGTVAIEHLASAGGDFTILSRTAILAGTGAATGGGSFYFSGEDLSISGDGLQTGGGDVEIRATGHVSISWLGIQTGTSEIAGGKFNSSGRDFSATGGGITTYGGDVAIDHTGAVTIGRLYTSGGHYSSRGSTLRLDANGLATNGGNVVFDHQGDVFVTDNGINTRGGNLTSAGPGAFTNNGDGINVGSASSVRLVHSGIFLTGYRFQGINPDAEIVLHASCREVNLGNLLLNGHIRVSGGTFTAGRIAGNGGRLNVTLTASSDVLLNNSIISNTGDVAVYALGAVRLPANAEVADDPDGIITGGGNIEIKSKTSINSGKVPGFDTSPGTGGAFTQSGSLITLAAAPTTGSGDVVLVIDPDLIVPFGSDAIEICNGIDDNCDGVIDEGVACAPLPVKLVHFHLAKEEAAEGVLLQWTTAEENNSEAYVIERSSDGRHWAVLGRVKASGMSSSVKSYLFYDHAPVQGANYYRLKMMDADGTYTYSVIRIIAAGSGSAGEMVVSPNPLGSLAYLTFQSGADQNIRMEMLSMDGKVMLSKDFEAVKGANRLEFQTEFLQQGVYIVRISGSDHTGAKRVIK